MPDDGAAIPAGLKRILADSFVLGFMAQAALWRIDRQADGSAVLLERLISLLGDTARDAAVRMRVLGETPPISIDELVRLASCHPPNAWEQTVGVAHLAYAALQVARDFNTIGAIARESGDEATAYFLFSRVGAVEEAVWSLGRLGAEAEDRNINPEKPA